jgi:hypothetical protein
MAVGHDRSRIDADDAHPVAHALAAEALPPEELPPEELPPEELPPEELPPTSRTACDPMAPSTRRFLV